MDIVNIKESEDVKDEILAIDEKSVLQRTSQEEFHKSKVVYENIKIASSSHSFPPSSSLSSSSISTKPFYQSSLTEMNSSIESSHAQPRNGISEHYSINPPYFPKKYKIHQVHFSEEDLHHPCSSSSCPDITMVTQLTYFHDLFIIL